MELSGRIIMIMDTEEFDSGFKKRDFVIQTEGDYPQDVKMELIKDKVDLMDQYNVDDTITVSFNIRGNENNGRYYVNLHAWKIKSS